MKLTRQNIMGAIICGSIPTVLFVVSWIQMGTKAFFAGLMWGTSAPGIMLWFALFCAAIGTQLRVSAQQAKGCILGTLVGALPFVLVWFFEGAGSFTSAEMSGMPALVIAPFAALCGAIAGVKLLDRKQ